MFFFVFTLIYGQKQLHLSRQHQFNKLVLKQTLLTDGGNFDAFFLPDAVDGFFEVLWVHLDALEVIRAALSGHSVELGPKDLTVVVSEVNLQVFCDLLDF